jgi:hypothetical protein
MIDVLVICGDMADMPSALAAKQFRLLPRIILAGEFEASGMIVGKKSISNNR